jgi:hypothetical protein
MDISCVCKCFLLEVYHGALEMNVEIKRFEFSDKYTIGKLYVDGVYHCYTLEDKDGLTLGKDWGGTGKLYSLIDKEKAPFGAFLYVTSQTPELQASS